MPRRVGVVYGVVVGVAVTIKGLRIGWLGDYRVWLSESAKNRVRLTGRRLAFPYENERFLTNYSEISNFFAVVLFYSSKRKSKEKSIKFLISADGVYGWVGAAIDQ